MTGRRRPGFERGQEMAVLDVVAESLESDFGSVETHLGRADQAAGGVDDPHDAKRRGVRLRSGPDAERFQRGHGTGKQAPWCDDPGAARRAISAVVNAGFGQRNGRRQPGRAAANNRHF